jgi:hypothetical protein
MEHCSEVLQDALCLRLDISLDDLARNWIARNLACRENEASGLDGLRIRARRRRRVRRRNRLLS